MPSCRNRGMLLLASCCTLFPHPASAACPEFGRTLRVICRGTDTAQGTPNSTGNGRSTHMQMQQTPVLIFPSTRSIYVPFSFQRVGQHRLYWSDPMPAANTDSFFDRHGSQDQCSIWGRKVGRSRWRSEDHGLVYSFSTASTKRWTTKSGVGQVARGPPNTTTRPPPRNLRTCSDEGAFCSEHQPEEQNPCSDYLISAPQVAKPSNKGIENADHIRNTVAFQFPSRQQAMPRKRPDENVLKISICPMTPWGWWW
jgi:hypothetical protein